METFFWGVEDEGSWNCAFLRWKERKRSPVDTWTSIVVSLLLFHKVCIAAGPRWRSTRKKKGDCQVSTIQAALKKERKNSEQHKGENVNREPMPHYITIQVARHSCFVASTAQQLINVCPSLFTFVNDIRSFASHSQQQLIRRKYPSSLSPPPLSAYSYFVISLETTIFFLRLICAAGPGCTSWRDKTRRRIIFCCLHSTVTRANAPLCTSVMCAGSVESPASIQQVSFHHHFLQFIFSPLFSFFFFSCSYFDCNVNEEDEPGGRRSGKRSRSPQFQHQSVLLYRRLPACKTILSRSSTSTTTTKQTTSKVGISFPQRRRRTSSSRDDLVVAAEWITR